MNGLRHLAVGAMLLVAAAIPAAVADAATATVSIGERLEPARLTVAVGTAVTWTNDDDERHRVRSRDGVTEFDSGNLEPGETFTFVFEAPGDHPYVDEREPEDAAYHGAITVTGGGQTGSGGASTDPGDASGTGGGAAPSDAGGAPSDVDVAVLDRSFSPASIEVSAGSSVTWTNRSDREHTVTFRSGGGSGEFGGGGTFTHTFDAPGTFDYLCAIHPEMTGTVTVAGAGPAPSGDAAGPDAGDGATTGDGDADGTNRTSGSTAAPSSPGSSAASVSAVEFEFVPARVSVVPGGQVTWTNDGVAPHTVAGEGFGSPTLRPGGSFSRRFETPGTYPYRCTLHPQMTGTVVVQDAAEEDSGGDGSLPGAVGGGEGDGGTTGDAPSPSVRSEPGAAASATRVERATTPLGGPLGVVLSFIVGIAAGAAGMRFRR